MLKCGRASQAYGLHTLKLSALGARAIAEVGAKPPEILKVSALLKL